MNGAIIKITDVIPSVIFIFNLFLYIFNNLERV